MKIILEERSYHMLVRLIKETVGSDVKTIEDNSQFFIEFHVYSVDQGNPESDKDVATLEHDLSALGSESTVQKDDKGIEYTMYRIKNQKFNNMVEIANFFKTQFGNFQTLITKIFQKSKNYIRVVVVDTNNPPNRIPGRSYAIVSMADFNTMITNLQFK
jgi:hypothetical protein